VRPGSGAARSRRWPGVDLFAPRDAVAATRALRAVLLLAALVLGTHTALQPPATGLGVVVAVVLVLAVAAGMLARVRCPGWAFGAVPVLGVGAVAVLDVLTNDASTAAQVFFLLPVLFAGTHLRPAGAWSVTAVAVAGEAVTTLVLLPLDLALTDCAFVSAVAVATTLVLVRSNRGRDLLLAELRRQAAVDPLTGLVTRRVLDDAAACALAGADVTGSDVTDGTGLLVIDVDHFKEINDTHGHPAGDALLAHLGELLRGATGSSAVACRLGGDELAVLLPATSLEASARRAALLVDLVRERPLVLAEPGTAPVRVGATLSIGVAHAPEHAVDLLGLYRAADDALYRAKRAGRDRAAVATPRDAPVPSEASVRPPTQRSATAASEVARVEASTGAGASGLTGLGSAPR